MDSSSRRFANVAGARTGKQVAISLRAAEDTDRDEPRIRPRAVRGSFLLRGGGGSVAQPMTASAARMSRDSAT